MALFSVKAEEKVEDATAEIVKQTKLKELSESVVRQLEEEMDEMRLKQKVSAGKCLVGQDIHYHRKLGLVQGFSTLFPSLPTFDVSDPSLLQCVSTTFPTTSLHFGAMAKIQVTSMA